MLAVFWQSTDHDFLTYDDNLYVTDNLHVKTGLTYRNMLWAFTTMEASNWHPVTWWSHMLDSQIYGLNPKGHHLTNVLFHIANTLLLLYLLFSATRNYWQSLFVAALFGLHPLHVESVAWIAERKDLVSTFFGFVALILYFRYAKHPRPFPYLLSLVAYAVGLMAKPMLVTLPFVMLLCDVWPLGRLRLETKPLEYPTHDMGKESSASTRSRLVVEKIPFFVLSLASCIVTYVAQNEGGAVADLQFVPFLFRIVNALLSYVRYISKMFWPHHLAVIYPMPPTLTMTQGITAGLLLLGISYLVYRLARKHPYLFVGWLWYLGTLVPVIGLVQVGNQALADRYTYIPLIGLFIMMSWGAWNLVKNFRYWRILVPVAVGLTLTALTISTWVQLSYWKNSVTLFQHASMSVTDNYIAYIHLGDGLSQQGKFTEAIDYYLLALRFRPNRQDIHTNLAVAYDQAGNIEAAINHYLKALSLDPGNAKLNYNLGLAFGVQGNLKESLYYLGRAVTINPKFPEAHYNLGVALAKQGRLDEGIRHFREALQADPGWVEARKALETAMRLKSEQPSHK
jgi:Tfp pilus assembly protein PilF